MWQSLHQVELFLYFGLPQRHVGRNPDPPILIEFEHELHTVPLMAFWYPALLLKQRDLPQDGQARVISVFTVVLFRPVTAPKAHETEPSRKNFSTAKNHIQVRTVLGVQVDLRELERHQQVCQTAPILL